MMRASLLPGVLLVLALSACGGKKPAENAENDTSGGDAGASSDPGSTPPNDDKPPSGDDKPQPSSPCSGFDLDLVKALSQAACETTDLKPSDKDRDLKGTLEIKLATSTAKVAPGGHVDVTITFTNKGKTDLPLYFTVDPEPRFVIQIYDAKGNRADLPPGAEPKLPANVANAQPPDKKIARAVVVQSGTAKLTLGWDAVKMKWAPAEKAKGALPGRGYPTVPGGPLGKGKYTLRVVTPLVGVFEGIDHEMSQPRVPIEVGN